MPYSDKHRAALDLAGKNRIADALRLLAEALQEQETSDLWNDWATLQVANGNANAARQGYENALTLDAKNIRAKFNLGLLLANLGEFDRGLKLLRKCLGRMGRDEDAAIAALLREQGNKKARAVETSEAGNSHRKKILLIHDVLPHFDRSGSDMRIMQVIRRLRAAGHELTYIARHPADREQYEPALRELGVRVLAGDAERLRAMGLDLKAEWKLKDVLKAEQFDVAILFHWFWSGISVSEQYLDDIRRFSSTTRIAVLTDDRHGIREWRMAELSGLLSDRERAMDFLSREFECYQAADLVLAISEDDHRGLLELAPQLMVELLPMTADINHEPRGLDSRRDFVTLANWDNVANRDAIQWLLQDIWPRIRQRLPGASLYLAGNNIPSEFASDNGVNVLGYVADLQATLEQFRVFLAPIRFGTGIKTKTLVAMGQGIPVVTTTIGAEGISLTDGENAMLADTAGAFANKAVELYRNDELWHRLSSFALKHMEGQFSVAHLDTQIARIMGTLDSLRPRPADPEHRFSMNLVEEIHPEVLNGKPAETRFRARAMAYMELAERLLGLNKPAEAREQLRHLFIYVRGQHPRIPMFAKIFSLLERCYREMGEPEPAANCGQEAKLCLPELNPALIRPPVAKIGTKKRHSESGTPVISIVIPTYNRKTKLSRCLGALASQTLPADEFEVIVVDDGSTDGTEHVAAEQADSLLLHYYRQSNRGAGAARRAGVDYARGEYLLFLNDDSIAHADLLREHLFAQRQHATEKLAILGSFEYEAAARNRALTWFLSIDPFMFPQARMRAGTWCSAAEFITCNLSVRRDMVLQCGSFDAAFRLGEDSELGLRLMRFGAKILYHPQARAWHDHLDVTMDSLIQRAKAYGPVYLQLLRKHEDLKTPTPFGTLHARMNIVDIEELRKALSAKCAEIGENVNALRRFDSIDFSSFFNTRAEGGLAAEVVMNLFRQAIPYVHWFYVVESFCSLWLEAPPVAPAVSADLGANR